MHHPRTDQRDDPFERHRSARPGLSPYYVDDLALTLSDIVRARTDQPSGTASG